MTDIVNAFFHKHYPADADTAWVLRQCVNSYGRDYNGTEREKRIFPAMVCADGFEMSVQGHWGGYCEPRGDFEPQYRSVEVSTAPQAEQLLVAHGGTDYDEFSIYGYVPIELIEKIVVKHGGLQSLTGA